MHFGNIDKTDFLIPPFALFYFYLVFAAAFGWPLGRQAELFHSDLAAWIGVLLCLAGLVLFFLSLISFGKSFRVGIDDQHPDALVTTGLFALTRNPLYVAFLAVFVGQFLIHPNWTFLIYLAAAFWVINRQVLREEAYLKSHYGQECTAYCQRVRRYL
jgi:protein-S-isoprenylcysteine O-methyltransferase Ste14